MANPDDRIGDKFEQGKGAYSTAGDLKDAENANSAYQDGEGSTDQPGDAVRDAESSSSGSWSTNLDSFRDSKNTNKSANPVVTVLKKGGPGGIMGGGLIAFLFMSFFVAPGSLLINLKENFVANFDQQAVTAQSRTNRMMVKRLTDTDTKGACTTIKLACKYTKPSKRFLTNLNDAGIKAIAADGTEMTPDDQRWGSRERPVKYKLADGSLEFNAKEFNTALRNNPAVRVAFTKAHNPRWVNWVDKKAITFFQKNGASKLVSKIFSKKDVKARQDAFDDLLKNKNASATAVKDAVNSEGKKLAKSTAKKISGKTDAVFIGTAVACAGFKVPGAVSNVFRAYRMRNVIAAGFVFLTLADAIKSGSDVTPEQSSAAGDMLTAVVAGKSAMDGSVKYGLFKDAASASNSSSLKKFMPGAGLGILDTFNKIANGKAAQQSCAVANSAELQAVVAAAKIANSWNPAGWIAILETVVAFAGSALIGKIIEVSAPYIIDFMSGLIDWNKALDLIIGNDAVGVTGEELGDVVSLGGALGMGQLANQGGNIPLTPAQKVAFDQSITTPTQLAWAEEDRLTHSPLDATNPNTALGAITTKLLPLMASVRSASSFLTLLPQTSLGGFGSLLRSQSVHAASEADWELCKDDYAIKASGVAAGPLCDIQYGVPAEYMGLDPEDVLTHLKDLDQIDDEGNPKSGSDLEEYVAACNDGLPSIPDDCIITPGDDKSAYFALYQIDTRVIDTMDNEPPIPGSGAAGAGSSATAATPEICKTLAPTDSGQIACHAYQFSNTMYKWGGGHSGTAAQFMADFKAGKYPPGSATVDCSGLVRMTIFETYGVDIGGAGSDSFFSTGHFDKVPPEQAKPGDLIIILGSHVEIVVNNKVDQRSFDTIGAHSVHLPLGQSIGPVSDWYNYSKASYILRWKG